MWRRIISLCGLIACTGPVASPSADAGRADSGGFDDAGVAAEGQPDGAISLDAGIGPADSGPIDSGPIDSGPIDSGPIDSGPGADLDAGTPDGGDDAGSSTDAGVDAGPGCDGGPCPLNWFQLPLLPTPRVAPLMAFDSVRSVVIVLGGADDQFGGGYRPDDPRIWEFDGTTWSVQQSPLTPPLRVGGGMVFDSARGVAVLFGGTTSFYGGSTSSAEVNDTWEWDGATWTQRLLPSSPPPRAGFGIAYDSARAVTVLWGGGGSDGGMLDDTWEYDGTAWTQRMPATSPTAGEIAEMVYDSRRQVTVLYGGFVTAPATWEWDGTNWKDRTPASNPSVLYSFGFSYDSAQGVALLFGGNTVEDLGSAKTWAWDGTNWAEQMPRASPEYRFGDAMAFDSTHGVSVMFGGEDPLGIGYNDTWTYDGTNWTLVGTPSSVYANPIAYDSVRQVVVMYGATADVGPGLTDTWQWNGVWTPVFPATRPPDRQSTALAFDEARGEAVLFGGSDTYDILNDTWTWDGSDWTQQRPTTSPSARYSPAMAYDSARQVTVLFGGCSEPARCKPLADTWEWDGTSWSRRAPHELFRPSARANAAMAYDAARGVTVLFGGGTTKYETGLTDTWEWDGLYWIQKVPAHIPPAPERQAMAYDSRRGVSVLLECSGAFTLSTWEWDGTDWAEQMPADMPVAPNGDLPMAYDAALGLSVLGEGNATWVYGTP